jgi:hypothetical protein
MILFYPGNQMNQENSGSDNYRMGKELSEGLLSEEGEAEE